MKSLCISAVLCRTFGTLALRGFALCVVALGAQEARADDAFRKVQPAAAAEKPFAVPPVQTAKAAGFEIVLVEDHSLPAVNLRIAFPSGSAVDDAAHAGRTALCVRTLNEGPARLTKVAYEEALADLAVNVDIGAGTEQTVLSLRALKEVWRPALDLAIEVVAKPGLRADDLDRVRARALAQLAQQKGSAAGIAARLQNRVLWGEQHPLGALVTEATLKAVTPADCAAVAKGLAPGGARVFVAGDVTLDEVKAALTETTAAAGFAGRAKTSPSLPPPRTAGAPTVVFVDVKGAEQSVVTLLAEGPTRQAADHEATSVMMNIFGGGFSSRVNMNLREKHGYTYGARAGLSYTKQRGVFSAGASVRTDATGAALKELALELANMKAGPLTADEVARERDGALAALPATFATSTSTLDAWSGVYFYGLPKDTLQQQPKKLRALTDTSLAATAKQRLPKAVRVFVVGDASKVKAELDAIAAAGTFGKAGAVLVVDADGNVVR